MKRRSFLKLTGIGLVGAAAAPVASAISGNGSSMEPDPKAVKAHRVALVIDTRKCLKREGCTACSDACAHGHNVPKIPDVRHEVKWIWKEPLENVFPEHVTPYTPAEEREHPTLVTCNHCDNPPCVRVCPTQATWKRADGIVMMDMHRCIGCRYCMSGCPYGARSFNWEDPRKYIQEPTNYPTRTKGVVEKCTLCYERLAVGERPLCVEACERIGCGAITFGDMADPNSKIAAILRENPPMRRKPELGTSPHVFYIL